MKRWIWFGVLVLIIMVFALLFAQRGQAPVNQQGSAELGPADTSPSPLPADGGTKVLITADGFSPDTLEISVGGSVTWQNSTSSRTWPASDPHPQHTGLAGFDALRGLAEGEEYSFTFQKAGTYTYHDHLRPALTATIVVK